MINKETKIAALSRLKRIEGQVRGVRQMVDEEKYCIDIIDQLNAVRRALEQVALMVMERHIESCVVDSIKRKDGACKIRELINSIDKFIR